MRERSDELLFIWLNPRIELITNFSARHRALTDVAVALLMAMVSILGLIFQNAVRPLTLGFCFALPATLLIRHKSAFACFALAATVALAQWIWSIPQLADASVLVALYWVTLECGLREIVLSIAGTEIGAILVATGWEPGQGFKYWVAVTGLIVAAAALGIMIRQRRVLIDSLEEKAARLERERDQQGRLGAAAERARIAREMHDIVSHNLTVMIALADGAGYALQSSPSGAQSAIERVSSTGRQALLEMRRLLGVLRDDADEQPLEPQPSLERLDDLLARVEEAGVPVTIELEGDPHQLAPGVQLAVFRVAQEALTNTLKHAVRPTSAHLSLRCRPGHLDLEVTNTGGENVAGSAADPDSGHGRGLRGMRERASAYGGELEVGPVEQGGWRVHLHLEPDVIGEPR
jgi:signal transduction histidine kinase